VRPHMTGLDRSYIGQLYESCRAAVTHDMPATDLSKAHYLAYVGLEPYGLRGQVEQLWLSRPVADREASSRFVVSCIPFCAYGISRGDVIELGAKSSAVARVVRPSGRTALRLLIRRRVADEPADRKSAV